MVDWIRDWVDRGWWSGVGTGWIGVVEWSKEWLDSIIYDSFALIISN